MALESKALIRPQNCYEGVLSDIHTFPNDDGALDSGSLRGRLKLRDVEGHEAEYEFIFQSQKYGPLGCTDDDLTFYGIVEHNLTVSAWKGLRQALSQLFWETFDPLHIGDQASPDYSKWEFQGQLPFRLEEETEEDCRYWVVECQPPAPATRAA